MRCSARDASVTAEVPSTGQLGDTGTLGSFAGQLSSWLAGDAPARKVAGLQQLAGAAVSATSECLNAPTFKGRVVLIWSITWMKLRPQQPSPAHARAWTGYIQICLDYTMQVSPFSGRYGTDANLWAMQGSRFS
jgi:hypothetical protein